MGLSRARAHAKQIPTLSMVVVMPSAWLAISLHVTNHGTVATSVQMQVMSFESLGGVEKRLSSDTVMINPPIGASAPGATETVTLVLSHLKHAKQSAYRVLLVGVFTPSPCNPVRQR